MRKLAAAAFSFSAACSAAYFMIPHRLLLLCAIVCALLSLSGLFFKGNIRFRIFVILLAAAAGLGWSCAYTVLFIAPALRLDNKQVSVSAIVLDFPAQTENGHSAELSIREKGYPPAKALLFADGIGSLRPGDEIEFTASFKLTSQASSASDYFVSRGILLFAYLSGELTVIRSDDPLLYLPQRLSNAIAEMPIFPPDVSPFMLAILTGNRGQLNDDAALSASLSLSGISHAAAVSGMHVSFLIGFLNVFIRKKRLLAFTAIPALFLFMAMTGFTPSVSRAGIMQIFLICAPLFRRETDGITSLSAALFILLAVNPNACASAGLQLSFAASLGIILFTARIDSAVSGALNTVMLPAPKITEPAVRFITSSLSATAGALILTTPLTALYFGYISIIAPLTNLVTLWAVSLAFSCGLAACILGLIFLPLGIIAAFPVTGLSRYIAWAARTLAGVPFASVYVSNMLIAIWLAYVYLMLVFLAALKASIRKYLLPGCFAVMSLCVILLVSSIQPVPGNASVTALNVGQGQCVALTSGDYTALVDCGGDTGKTAASAAREYLSASGRLSVDLLVLTHFHDDHVNGVAELLSTAKVYALAVPDPEIEDGYNAEDIVTLARKRGADIIYVTETLEISLGGASVILYPPLGDSGENERGVSVLFSEDGFHALITGDMDAPGERRLLRFADLPDIDLLVVGHHGSKYSTSKELLEAVTPEVAVISVGRNSYGHPTAETLRRLMEYGVSIYRTDVDGSVTFSGGE